VLELSLRQKGTAGGGVSAAAIDERGRALFATDGFVALYEIRDRTGGAIALRFQ